MDGVRRLFSGTDSSSNSTLALDSTSLLSKVIGAGGDLYVVVAVVVAVVYLATYRGVDGKIRSLRGGVELTW